MKRLAVFVLVFLATVPLFAVQYEKPMIDMVVPSGLENNQMYVNFGHKFYRTLAGYPGNDMFALLKSGANLNLQLRYMIWNGIEVKAAYDLGNDEKNIGLSYVLKFPQLFFNTQADFQFFDYEDLVLGQQARNLFYLVSVETIPLWNDRVTAAINVGYDGYYNTARFGIGACVEVIKDLSLTAEFYPNGLGGEGDDEEGGGSGAAAAKSVFSFGLKYFTYGHQFMLKFGNSAEMEPRMLMQGAATNEIFVGLSMMRLVDFNPEEQAAE